MFELSIAITLVSLVVLVIALIGRNSEIRRDNPLHHKNDDW
jgi:hypothetical protein